LKQIAVLLVSALASSSAFAINAVPEIDGTLSVLMFALVGGLALLLKKTKD
jgi:hypothetical protein